jgi:hypothetical protein
MPEQLDPAVAENLANGAMRYLPLTPGNKILGTKRQLQECLVALAQEAYAMGFLSGQKEHFSLLVFSGAAQRPAWMDIRLDNLSALASHGFRLRPAVLRSLIGAGYHQLGDLCWASDHELRKLFYVGRKTARHIRTVIWQLRARPLEPRTLGMADDGQRISNQCCFMPD